MRAQSARAPSAPGGVSAAMSARQARRQRRRGDAGGSRAALDRARRHRMARRSGVRGRRWSVRRPTEDGEDLTALVGCGRRRPAIAGGGRGPHRIAKSATHLRRPCAVCCRPRSAGEPETERFCVADRRRVSAGQRECQQKGAVPLFERRKGVRPLLSRGEDGVEKQAEGGERLRAMLHGKSEQDDAAHA